MPRASFVLAALALVAPAVAHPQSPPPPPIVSPQVLPDRHVVFRLRAPKAAEIVLTGDWMGPREQPAALTRDADGVWSVAVGPLEPNVYQYSYLVDGVRAIDPANRRAALADDRTPSSLVQVDGPVAMPWARRAVPRGVVHRETLTSALQGRERSYAVYTPPGYDPKAARAYPTLVLLPGTPGSENDWLAGGLAGYVLDNLIADGAVAPMVVLMPRSDVLTQPGTRADNLAVFEPLLLTEILPHFERRYAVQALPESRAIAGYSLGGELALTVGLRHPELFRSVGSFGGSVFERDFEDRFGRALANPAAVNRYRVLWIGSGAGDLLLPGNQELSTLLTAKDIRHTLRVIPGYHATATFRALLVEFLPALFR